MPSRLFNSWTAQRTGSLPIPVALGICNAGLGLLHGIVDIMGTLNVASWGFLIGAGGQFAFYAALFPHLPAWVVWSFLLPPWLTVYTISFCRQPPFGTRAFRYALVFAMCWYGMATLLAESLRFLLQPTRSGHFSFAAARPLMYLGALSFIVFVRFCIALRRHEVEKQI
jgi:hypothetical protein